MDFYGILRFVYFRSFYAKQYLRSTLSIRWETGVDFHLGFSELNCQSIFVLKILFLSTLIHLFYATKFTYQNNLKTIYLSHIKHSTKAFPFQTRVMLKPHKFIVVLIYFYAPKPFWSKGALLLHIPTNFFHLLFYANLSPFLTRFEENLVIQLSKLI